VNRNDVIDVLSVVAAATRRSVGETDVDVWQAVIGDLGKEQCLLAVRDHLRDRPGVWLEPGHIVERVKAKRRDELDRESDEERDERQKALERKVAQDVAELAEQKAIPGPAKVSRPTANPLMVHCPWCHSGVGTRCIVPRTSQVMREFHPSRVEAAKSRAA
jgi:hypothetical protein